MNPYLRVGKYLPVVGLALVLLAPGTLRAQNESDIVEYLKAGKEDASKLMGAYMTPVVEGLSYGFNGGWFHTAKAHKTLGFDLGVSVNAVFLPSSKNYFNPADLNLQAAVQLDTLLDEPELRVRCRVVARRHFDLSTVGGVRYRRVYARLAASDGAALTAHHRSEIELEAEV